VEAVYHFLVVFTGAAYKTAFLDAVVAPGLVACLSKLSENQSDRLLIEPPTFPPTAGFTGDIGVRG